VIIARLNSSLGFWCSLVLFSVLIFLTHDICIGESLSHVGPNLFRRFEFAIHERNDIHRVYNKDAECFGIRKSVFVSFKEIFPVISGDLDGKFAHVFSLVASAGNPIAPYCENTAKNGGGGTANNGGIKSDGRGVGWHDVNLVLLAWCCGYAGGTVLMVFVMLFIEKRRR
jgi:hypothetical protein